MITSRNPMKDNVAFAGAATTGFTPNNTDRSEASFAAEACISVLRQCGLKAADIDGICGSIPSAAAAAGDARHPGGDLVRQPGDPVRQPAVGGGRCAVHSGLCDMVLAYHAATGCPGTPPPP